MANYTVQDLFGAFLAFSLYPLAYVIPGYVIAWLLELFDFRKRLLPARLAIAVVISLTTSPILIYLTSLVSFSLTFAMLGIFALAFIGLVIIEGKKILSPPAIGLLGRYQRLAVFVAIGWVLLAIFSLVDIQWGQRIYFSVVAYDYTTRVSLIDAMTRTGIPPVNPTYFPGQPVRLTFLYYFWYIPASLVDQLGGKWISPYQAMIASSAWSGLQVMAIVALYLRLRNPGDSLKIWKNTLLGISFLAVTGLDAIPALTNMLTTRLNFGFMWPPGDIEHWNQQITAWMGSALWVPHHLAGAIACLTGMLLMLSVRTQSPSRQLRAALITGLGFASAIGLSTWVTIAFAVFWGLWLLTMLIRKERALAGMMLLAGLVAVIAAAPFLAGALDSGSSSGGALSKFPVSFEVRLFGPVLSFAGALPPLARDGLQLLLLPVNYMLELGFFFAAGLLWLQKNGRAWRNQPFFSAEVILLAVVVFIGSFIRSSIIGANDLGWRCWLLGQFVLLVWAVDVFALGDVQPGLAGVRLTRSNRKTLALLLALGVFSTVVDLSLLRTWTSLIDTGLPGFPSDLSQDTQLGKRTLAARQAYDYIRDQLPAEVVIQDNPAISINRPAGLYGTRQVAIADRTAYGVPAEAFKASQEAVSAIFETQSIVGWKTLDQTCRQYSIDVIITFDADPLWSSLPALARLRQPLYQNDYYALFGCGALADFTPGP